MEDELEPNLVGSGEIDFEHLELIDLKRSRELMDMIVTLVMLLETLSSLIYLRILRMRRTSMIEGIPIYLFQSQRGIPIRISCKLGRLGL
jgi:hypothetical protein